MALQLLSNEKATNLKGCCTSVELREDVSRSVLSYRLSRTSLFSGIIILGLLIAVVFHDGIGSIQGLRWPNNSFLFNPRVSFSDLTDSILCMQDWNPYNNNGKAGAYFPFAYICLLPFTTMPLHTAEWSFVLFSICLLSFLIVWWCRIRYAKGEWLLSSRDLIIAFVGSYPFLFAVDRGNLDLWVGSLLVLYLIGLRKGTSWGIWVAVFALASAVALKGYPILYIYLLTVERRYIASISVVILTIGFTFGSLAFFDGDIVHNLAGLRTCLSVFHEQYVIGNYSLHYFTDPYNLIRIFIHTTNKAKFWCDVFSLLFLVMSSFFVFFVSVPKWRKTLAIGITLLMCPVVANDYKLLVLLPGVLELTSVNEKMFFREKTALVLTALLFIPKHYYYFTGYDVSVSCIVSPIVVLLVSFIVFLDLAEWQAAFIGFRMKSMYYFDPVLTLYQSNERKKTI